jgi:hypothetical protein
LKKPKIKSRESLLALTLLAFSSRFLRSTRIPSNSLAFPRIHSCLPHLHSLFLGSTCVLLGSFVLFTTLSSRFTCVPQVHSFSLAFPLRSLVSSRFPSRSLATTCQRLFSRGLSLFWDTGNRPRETGRDRFPYPCPK